MRNLIFIVICLALSCCYNSSPLKDEVNPQPTLSAKFTNFADSTNIALKKNNSERIDFNAFAGEGIAHIRAEAVYKDVFDDKQEVFRKTIGFNSSVSDISVFNFTSPTNNEVIITITVTDNVGHTANQILTINKNIHKLVFL